MAWGSLSSAVSPNLTWRYSRNMTIPDYGEQLAREKNPGDRAVTAVNLKSPKFGKTTQNSFFKTTMPQTSGRDTSSNLGEVFQMNSPRATTTTPISMNGNKVDKRPWFNRIGVLQPIKMTATASIEKLPKTPVSPDNTTKVESPRAKKPRVIECSASQYTSFLDTVQLDVGQIRGMRNLLSDEEKK